MGLDAWDSISTVIAGFLKAGLIQFASDDDVGEHKISESEDNRRCSCLPELAVCVYQATGVSHVMYALLQAKLTDANWNKLECDHNASLRLCLGLPRHSKVASMLAKAPSLATTTADAEV